MNCFLILFLVQVKICTKDFLHMDILMHEALEIEFRGDPTLQPPNPNSPRDSLTDTEDESPKNLLYNSPAESNATLLSSQVHNLHHSMYSVTRKSK